MRTDVLITRENIVTRTRTLAAKARKVQEVAGNLAQELYLKEFDALDGKELSLSHLDGAQYFLDQALRAAGAARTLAGKMITDKEAA